MAELTEELTRDLSKIFENAVFGGLTEGAKKALKDQAFKQLEQLIGLGLKPGSALSVVRSASLLEGLRASRGSSGPGPGVIAGAGLPGLAAGPTPSSIAASPSSIERRLHARDQGWFSARSQAAGGTGPSSDAHGPKLNGPLLDRVLSAIRDSGAPSFGAGIPSRGPTAWPRTGPDFSRATGLNAPVRLLGPGGGGDDSHGWTRIDGGWARAGGIPWQARYGGTPAAAAAGGGGMPPPGAPPLGGAAPLGGAPPLGGAQPTSAPAPVSSYPTPLWMQRTARGVGAAGAWAAGKARGFMSAAWKGIATRFLNPANIAIATGTALLSPLWGSMDSAAATDDQLWDAARPLMGGLLQTDTTDVATGVYTDPHIDDPHTARPVRAPNRSQISLVKRRSSTAPSGDWGDVMGGYRDKTALFADMASRGYSKRQAIEMVGSAARGASMGGMRQEMDLQARIHGYVTPAISGEWLHQQAMGGFASSAGIENSLRNWIGMPGFARKGQDMLSLESQMAASFQAGGAMSFNQDVFRAGVAGARNLGLTMGAAVALQQKASMAGLGVSTGGSGQAQEDLWRLHMLGGLDLTKGYVSPEMMLKGRRSAETAKYEDVLARAKKMGGSGDLGKLLAQDFMQIAGVPISVGVLEATPGAPQGERGTYTPASRGRTRAQRDAAEVEFIDTLASYDASAASGAVKTQLAEVKGLLSKLYKVIADLAGAQ